MSENVDERLFLQNWICFRGNKRGEKWMYAYPQLTSSTQVILTDSRKEGMNLLPSLPSNSGNDSDSIPEPLQSSMGNTSAWCHVLFVWPLALRNQRNTPSRPEGVKTRSPLPIAVSSNLKMFHGGFFMRASQSCCCLLHLGVNGSQSWLNREPASPPWLCLLTPEPSV